MIDHLKEIVIDQIKNCTDPDLLDLIFKLLIAECGN